MAQATMNDPQYADCQAICDQVDHFETRMGLESILTGLGKQQEELQLALEANQRQKIHLTEGYLQACQNLSQKASLSSLADIKTYSLKNMSQQVQVDEKDLKLFGSIAEGLSSRESLANAAGRGVFYPSKFVSQII